MFGVYEDRGIRFEYPADWDLEVSDEGARSTVGAQAPGGLAFVLVTVDEDRPAPADLADEALSAMRDEYPQLEVIPAVEEIDGHRAVGHDVEFFSLDMLNACAIRCYRTPRRTVMVFGQWAEIPGEDAEDLLRAVRRSLEETDSGGQWAGGQMASA